MPVPNAGGLHTRKRDIAREEAIHRTEQIRAAQYRYTQTLPRMLVSETFRQLFCVVQQADISLELLRLCGAIVPQPADFLQAGDQASVIMNEHPFRFGIGAVKVVLG